MRFKNEGRIVEIKGDPVQTRAQFFEMPTQTWEEEDQGFLVEFNGINLNRSDEEANVSAEIEEQKMAPEFQRLIETYQDVFAIPMRPLLLGL